MRVCESTNQMSRWGVLLTNARSKLFDLLQVSRDSLLQTVMRVVNTDEVDGRPITGVLELLCEQFD